MNKQKTSQKDTAYAYMKGRLLSCAYLPGEALKESEIAAETRLGRTPIREALLKLQNEGFIDIFPRQGTRAKEITEQAVLELYQMRRIIEPSAAVKCRAQIDNVHLLDFQRRFHRFDEKKEYDPREFFALDTEFHRYLIDCIGNHTLTTVFCRLMQQSYRIHMLGVLADVPADYTRLSQQHIQMIHALLVEKADEIENIFSLHINTCRIAALQVLQTAKLTILQD